LKNSSKAIIEKYRRKTSLPGYLGNKSDLIVHHLAVMTPKCRIYEIVIGDRVYFTPDTLDQARKEGFTSCKNCID
jgi:hypothetical protein